MKTWLIIMCLLASPLLGAASGEDPQAHQGHQQGPHGGRLLQQESLTLEVSIYETGIPPEMRVYASTDGEPLPPAELDLEVVLHRLGGEKTALQFTPEQDYLVGDAVVKEPHSYEVTLNAHYQGENYQWRYQSYEGRTELSKRQVALANIVTETAGSREIHTTRELYGVIETPEDAHYRVHAPYAGIIKSVHIRTGDQVQQGQRLFTVQNQQTLQNYAVNSPAAGEVISRPATPGEHTDTGMLAEIADLASVWVKLSMFPEDIETLRKDMPVRVFDLHGHAHTAGQIDYIAPSMSGGHIAQARAVIENLAGYWRPGMHVKAAVGVDDNTVPLAVKRSALQSFHGKTVVFARFDDVFEVRMVELGRQDDDYVEITDGLAPGTEYVTENSYLLKADILKSGASHAH